MKKLTLITLFAFISIWINAQDNVSCFDTIINLQEVSVYSKPGLSILKSNNKNGSIHIRGKGKTSLVTRVDIDKNFKYNLDALEFFFNYQWQGFEGEGFYIRPLIFSTMNGKPNIDYLNRKAVYFVSKAINEVIHIDLSDLNIQIENANSFFIGIEFVDADGKSRYEDFNVTLAPLKKSLNTSFIKEIPLEFKSISSFAVVSIKGTSA